MTLVDHQIEELVNTQQLIGPFEPRNLRNCRYNLRAARAFLPKSGNEVVIDATPHSGQQTSSWSIEPSETLIIMTKESVRMPNNLFATYGQLNGMAQKGLSLINESIVEPGYQGLLSCFLVNFSKNTVHIHPNDPVAKICFHELSEVPRRPAPLTITPEDYRKLLIESAQNYPVSFLDIGGVEKRVEERVSDRVTKGINTSIKFGGAFIAVLVLWTTLEPLTNKFLWEKIGVMSNTQRQEIMQLRQELEKTKNDLAKAGDDLKAEKKLNDVEKNLQTLAEQINKLQQSIKRR